MSIEVNVAVDLPESLVLQSRLVILYFVELAERFFFFIVPVKDSQIVLS